MEKQEYKKMFDAENSYWWYVGRRFIVRSFLQKYLPKTEKRILDVGCGTGVNLELLKEFSPNVLGLDSSEDALAYCRSRGFENVQLIQPSGELGDTNSTYLVTMMDVLEHIKDENEMLKKIHKTLAQNGYLLVTVPAYQFLWSEHDMALHHFRRYTSSRLRHVLEKNGFEVLRVSYIITFSFPMVLMYRVLKGIINKFFVRGPKTSHVYLPDPINNFFIWLLKLEGRIVKYTNLPFGTSIIAIATRR